VASQGWKLQPEGAHLALSMTRCSSSNGTVLGVNARTERRESTAWLTVNWFMRGQLPIKGRLVKPKSFYLLHKNLTCGDMHLHDRMSLPIVGISWSSFPTTIAPLTGVNPSTFPPQIMLVIVIA